MIDWHKSPQGSLLAVPQRECSSKYRGIAGEVRENILWSYDPQIVGLVPKNEMQNTQRRERASSSETVNQKILASICWSLEAVSKFPKEGWITLLSANLQQRYPGVICRASQNGQVPSPGHLHLLPFKKWGQVMRCQHILYKIMMEPLTGKWEISFLCSLRGLTHPSWVSTQIVN